MLYWLIWYCTLPIRLVTSGFHWTMFRLGGKLRARVASIELDNRMLWEKLFSFETRLATLESHEAERKQAVLIEGVLQRFPERAYADPMGIDARLAAIERKIGLLE